MATPKKLPSGQWRAQGYYKDPITGKVSRPSFTAPSKAEAAQMVAEYQMTRDRAATPREMTVGECIDRYIDAKEQTLSPATIRGYRKMRRNNYARIEKTSIKYLTDEDVQIFVSDLCRDHSPKTVRNVYALFTSAVGMFSKRQFNATLPQKKPVEYSIPTDKDVQRLIEEAAPPLRLAIVLAAVGTLREGEVAALRFSDVDYARGGIRVHSDMVKNTAGEWVVKEVPKTSASSRFIPLPDNVMALIGTGEPDAFVYGRTPAAINRTFDRLRDRLDLKCRFHDLRHYAASIMHALGVPDVYIMERGGWKSDAILKSVYRNSLSDQSAKFATISNEHFAKLL